eukprot:COSAG01_NODE_3437_length_6098_cov_5.799800_7_plen_295_part_00
MLLWPLVVVTTTIQQALPCTPIIPHISPPNAPPPTTNSAELSHLTRPHARRDAHPRSAQPPRAPSSPRASRTARLGPCAAHAATAVSRFTASQTAQLHRPPPLPDVRHGRRPAKPAPIMPLHPLPPVHPAEPAPHTHSSAHRAVGCASASAPLLLRRPSTDGSFVPRLRESPPTPAAAHHSAALHLPGPLHGVGCPPQRPRRPWGAAARRARHLRNGQAAADARTAGQRPCAAAAAVSSGGGGARWTNQEAGSGDRDDYWARTRESSSGSQLGQRPAAAAAAVWRRSSAPVHPC